MTVYQLTRGTIAWRDGRYTRGEIIIDPPEFVLERFGEDLRRLDDSQGRIERRTLEQLPYDDVREIGAQTEGVDHAQQRPDLIDALASDGETTSDNAEAETEPTIEEQAARVARELDQRGEAPMYDGPDEGGDADPEAVEEEKEAILEELTAEDEEEGFEDVEDVEDVLNTPADGDETPE